MKSNRIHILHTRLANQIAAGEVIERPASVVKELIENSLDAGATRIDIEVAKGGLQLIRLRDDGMGIHPDDLPLAVSRHATSKVSSLSDIEQLQSLGFRGEALASIASVSRFNLTSYQEGQALAWKLAVEGRDMLPDLTPASHPRGTTVEVCDLFFNTPARRKFMRSEQTEWQHILELIKRIALSRFEISFNVVYQQKTVLQLRKADNEAGKLRRLQDICGLKFSQQAAYLEVSANGASLSGWVGVPSEAPIQASPQYFYVNGRMVRDKLLLHAVRQAYDALLPEGRQPVYVLYLEIDPTAVDVNVHPTKHEVRFRDSRLIHDFIVSSIKRVINSDTQEATTALSYRSKAAVPHISEQMALYHALHGEKAKSSPIAKHQDRPTLGIPLGQLHKRYLLIEQEEGLGVIDLTKAYEAIIYQRLQQAYADNGLKAQPLLIPTIVAVPRKLIKAIEQHQELLTQCAIDINVISDEQIILRALPAELRYANCQLLLTAVTDFLQTQAIITYSDLLRILAQSYFSPPKLLGSKEIEDFLQEINKIEPEIRQNCICVLKLIDIARYF